MTYVEEFRNALIAALRNEIVGPEWTVPVSDPKMQQTEILYESPVQRYSAGVLFPAKQPILEMEDTNLAEAPMIVEDPVADSSFPQTEIVGLGEDSNRSGDVDDYYEETVRLANEFLPSAMGMTFIMGEYPPGLIVQAHAAVYESREPSDPAAKFREWVRKPLELKPVILRIPSTGKCGIIKIDLADHLLLRAIHHRRHDGKILVTLSLLNSKDAPGDGYPPAADCFFQVGFGVTAHGGSDIFHEFKPSDRRITEPEDASLELLYRNRRSFAVGHGCAVVWGSDNEGKTDNLKTSLIPVCNVAPVKPKEGNGDGTSMFFLSGSEGPAQRGEIPTQLEAIARDYAKWISEQESGLGIIPANLRTSAESNLAACNTCLSRIRAGIETLRKDENMLTAFMLANRAMLMQQYHSRRTKRRLADAWEEIPGSYQSDSSKSGQWRVFQLAFILMNLPSIALQTEGQEHPDRKLVDLIWFPTGGGKTEAYLGLAAIDILYRRLVSPQNAGCAVLMRYTLRLLTAQQFQRASSLICACEIIRREMPARLGDSPISIGLWVGQSLTPTRRTEAIDKLNAMVGRQGRPENPFLLLKCPWCGTALDDPDHLGYHRQLDPNTVIFMCPDPRCPFSKRGRHLPVLVIDEDIYEAPPSLIIGTVDKFAMLAWRADSGRIFGVGTAFGPPDLIIQDELHLISGPLGSIVGLYEGAIDMLSSRTGRPPKIVASTATISRSARQCQALYDRPTALFPPQALDISDSYFASEDQNAPGRLYVGVFASASPSFVTAQVRALSSIFQSCKSIPLPEGAGEESRDPYWTVVQYFNSLRELGHAVTLVESDIPEYMWAIASRDHIRKDLCRRYIHGEELTSRRSAEEIPKILEHLEVRYPRKPQEDAPHPLDTLLATNMISVGVDISRLGLMVVIGQPKTTSEYIQATSRIGRTEQAPGLVITMYNPGRPRDRSHYEQFIAYHSAFYRFVEPTSVTPFSIPALDRALHAVLVIMIRQSTGMKRPSDLDPKADIVSKAINYLRQRCGDISPEHAMILDHRLRVLLHDWSEFLPGEWGGFGRPPENQPLMYPAGTDPRIEWDLSWPTPSSMRNVDVECLARVKSSYPDPNAPPAEE